MRLILFIDEFDLSFFDPRLNGIDELFLLLGVVHGDELISCGFLLNCSHVFSDEAGAIVLVSYDFQEQGVFAW